MKSIKFIDSNQEMQDDELGFCVNWRDDTVEGVRRGGKDLRVVDIDGTDRGCGGIYVCGAHWQSQNIIFKSFEAACIARDQYQMRKREILIGFKETLRKHFEEQPQPIDYL